MIDSASSREWLVGGGEMGDLIRSLDWSATPLGPRHTWPSSLRSIVATVVTSGFPMCVLWGPDLSMIYNDGYRRIAAERHPRALGRSTREIWPEAWAFNQPIFDRVMRRGDTVSLEDQPFELMRDGRTEHAYFTLAYGPIRDELGAIAGTLVTLIETTRRIHDERTSQQRLTEAQRISRLGNWEWHVQSGRASGSPQLYEIHGLTPSPTALSPETLQRSVHPEDQEKVRTAIANAIAQGAGIDLDYRIIRPDGAVRMIHAVGEVTERDAEGRPLVMVGTDQDVTERRSQEDLTRLHADLLRLSFDAIILWQLGGVISFWNRGAQELYGFTPEEAIGRSTNDLLQTVFPAPRTHIEATLQATGSWEGELRHRTKDGREVTVLARKQRIEGPHGTVRVLETNRDITARKRHEAALRESESRRRLAQQAARIGVFEWDLRTGVNTWSPELEAMYGLAPGTFENTQIAWENLLHPDDRAKGVSAVSRAFSTGAPVEEEWRVNWPDGSVHWLFGRFQVLRDDQGEPLCLTGVNIDISSRKQADEALRRSESEFRALTESLHTAVALIDRHGAFVIVNHAFRRLFAIPQDDDILNVNSRDWSAWQVLDDEGRLLDVDDHPVRMAAREKRPVKDQLIALRSPSSTELRWLLVSAEPIVDGDGALVRIIATFYDITERRRAEEATRASLAEKEVLLREIHHRVKNNMQVVTSLVNLQVERVADAAVRRNLQELSQRVRSMALVHESLYRSANLAALDLADYTRSLLQSVWRTYGDAAAGITLMLDLEPVLVTVEAALPCGLILNELATNALKHAFASTHVGTVTVSLRRMADLRVCLRVGDDGVGLPSDLDWQCPTTLGLSLVGLLAGQLSATLDVSSAGGTEVSLTFDGAYR